MSTPSYAELVQQIADLRADVVKPLTVEDLPLADLRKQLIDNGEPLDLSLLALDGQVADFGAAGVKIRSGSGTLVFTASVTSALLTVQHGLSTPVFRAIAIASADNWAVNVASANPTASTVDFRGARIDGAAVTANITFDWLAIA